MAPRLTKCLTASTICAGHERFGQRTATSPSSRTTGEPQAGQRSGMFHCGRASWAATLCSPSCSLSAGPTTWGMTSPARCTITSSPGRTSLRWMSSSLCRVARSTVTPPTGTGSSTAKGVSTPVRPTLTSMLCKPRNGRRRGELEGDRPARVVGDLAEVALQRDLVDLDHDPVDVVVDLGPPFDPGGTGGDHLLDGLVAGRRRVHPKALSGQPGERLPVAVELEALAVAELVAPDVERPRGGHGRVELTDGAGGGVARVGEGRLAGGRAGLVQAFEAGQRQVDLAAHLDDGRHRFAALERPGVAGEWHGSCAG